MSGCRLPVYDVHRFPKWPHMGPCGQPLAPGSDLYCKHHKEQEEEL